MLYSLLILILIFIISLYNFIICEINNYKLNNYKVKKSNKSKSVINPTKKTKMTLNYKSKLEDYKKAFEEGLDTTYYNYSDSYKEFFDYLYENRYEDRFKEEFEKHLNKINDSHKSYLFVKYGFDFFREFYNIIKFDKVSIYSSFNFIEKIDYKYDKEFIDLLYSKVTDVNGNILDEDIIKYVVYDEYSKEKYKETIFKIIDNYINDNSNKLPEYKKKDFFIFYSCLYNDTTYLNECFGNNYYLSNYLEKATSNEFIIEFLVHFYNKNTNINSYDRIIDFLKRKKNFDIIDGFYNRVDVEWNEKTLNLYLEYA